LSRIRKMLTRRCRFGEGDLFRMEFQKEPPVIQRYADELYARLLHEKKTDIPESGIRDRQTVDMNSLRHREVCEAGAEWPCYQSACAARRGQFSFFAGKVASG
jgi:hypothetical protein